MGRNNRGVAIGGWAMHCSGRVNAAEQAMGGGDGGPRGCKLGDGLAVASRTPGLNCGRVAGTIG